MNFHIKYYQKKCNLDKNVTYILLYSTWNKWSTIDGHIDIALPVRDSKWNAVDIVVSSTLNLKNEDKFTKLDAYIDKSAKSGRYLVWYSINKWKKDLKLYQHHYNCFSIDIDRSMSYSSDKGLNAKYVSKAWEVKTKSIDEDAISNFNEAYLAWHKLALDILKKENKKISNMHSKWYDYALAIQEHSMKLKTEASTTNDYGPMQININTYPWIQKKHSYFAWKSLADLKPKENIAASILHTENMIETSFVKQWINNLIHPNDKIAFMAFAYNAWTWTLKDKLEEYSLSHKNAKNITWNEFWLYHLDKCYKSGTTNSKIVLSITYGTNILNNTHMLTSLWAIINKI